jgi:hypothetical protein
MKSGRGLLIGLFLIFSITLPALAHASPPDPSWIPGIYDDADFDEVATLVVSAPGNILPDLPIDLGFHARWMQTLTYSEAAPEIPCAATDHSRAPPTS